MKERGKETPEIICVQRFLNWYNEQHKRNYIYQRADTHFPDLKDELNWDFVAYERDNTKEWIGIEVKELATTREISKWSKFWKGLCSELTRDLAVKGMQGKFEIIHPPVFNLKPEERLKFREAFTEVLPNKESILKAAFTDIGPDIADKFTRWPKDKSRNLDEYDTWGKYRPCELLINKSPDSRCEVTSPISPIVLRDVVEKHKETFNEVFKIKKGCIWANEQLKLAKEKGATKTILLLACEPFIYEDLIKGQVRNLDRHLISDIDCIYLVDMGSEGRVVKIYPD